MNNQGFQHCGNCGWKTDIRPTLLAACPSCHGRLKTCTHDKNETRKIGVLSNAGRKLDDDFLKV